MAPKKVIIKQNPAEKEQWRGNVYEDTVLCICPSCSASVSQKESWSDWDLTWTQCL